jgi:uncharacterized protein
MFYNFFNIIDDESMISPQKPRLNSIQTIHFQLPFSAAYIFSHTLIKLEYSIEYVDASSNMKITVFVKPNARKESVEAQPDGTYTVRVNAPPTEGKANLRVIELLAKNLSRPKSAFELLSGHRGKRKVFKVS